MPRIACILVSNFPIAAVVRADQALADTALVISDRQTAHAEVQFVSDKARALGVRVGMTLAQARAATSELVALPRRTASEHSAHEALIDVAESIAPIVEPGEPGCVWVDLAGLGRVYESEDTIASELALRVRRVGMEAAIGIAASKEVAHLAARCGGTRIIPSERTREFLDWLPLDVLGLDAIGGGDLGATLARWGL